jgi:hypothetical protein
MDLTLFELGTSKERSSHKPGSTRIPLRNRIRSVMLLRGIE